MKKNIIFVVILYCSFLSDLMATTTFNFNLKMGATTLENVIINALRDNRSNFLVGVDESKQIINDSNQINGSMGAGNRRFGNYTRAFWNSIKDQTVILQEDPVLINRLVAQNRLRSNHKSNYQRLCLFFIYGGYKFYLFDPWPPVRVKKLRKNVGFSRGTNGSSSSDGWRYPSSKIIRKYIITSEGPSVLPAVRRPLEKTGFNKSIRKSIRRSIR